MNLGAATYVRRNFVDRVVRGLCVIGTVVALIPLFSVLYYVLVRGIGGINLEFFTELPKPVGETGAIEAQEQHEAGPGPGLVLHLQLQPHQPPAG